MKQYDVVIGEQFGIMHGTGTLVFIKTGRGGTIEGSEGKYLSLSSKLAEKYGYAVAVSANPKDSACDLEEEIRLVSEHVGEYEEICFVGVSNGAMVGAEQCWKIDKIKNALLVNGPLTINWHRTSKGAERFKGKQMFFVYGDQDPSFRFFGLLDYIKNDACKYKIIEGEGHRLSNDCFEKLLTNFLDEQIAKVKIIG